MKHVLLSIVVQLLATSQINSFRLPLPYGTGFPTTNRIFPKQINKGIFYYKLWTKSFFQVEYCWRFKWNAGGRQTRKYCGNTGREFWCEWPDWQYANLQEQTRHGKIGRDDSSGLLGFVIQHHKEELKASGKRES